LSNVQYYYDGLGRATKIIMPNGTTTQKVYDEQFLLYQDQSCGGCGSTQITCAYDCNGNVITRTDAVGNTAISAYDAYDRVTRTNYYDNQSTPALLSCNVSDYDNNGNVTRSTTYDGSNNIVARSTYYYDKINRLYNTRNWAKPSGTEGDN
jgi:YD repeat-containing protein